MPNHRSTEFLPPCMMTHRLFHVPPAEAGFMAAAKACLIGMAYAFAAPLGHAERVTVEYEAEAATVVNQPFGGNVPRLTVVRGYFTYETETTDLKPADAMRGSFVLNGTWDFRAEFLDNVIIGSGIATASTNLYGSPTLSLNDGAGSSTLGIMTLNGVPRTDIGFGFAISGASKDLPTDQLPRKFTFNPPPGGAPHTFVLKDNAGQLNLQFRWFRQVGLAIKSIRRTGDITEIVWYSIKGNRYALEFSTDLLTWTIIRGDLIGDAVATTVFDDLAQRYPSEPLPPKGFYQIVDRAPPPANP